MLVLGSGNSVVTVGRFFLLRQRLTYERDRRTFSMTRRNSSTPLFLVGACEGRPNPVIFRRGLLAGVCVAAVMASAYADPIAPGTLPDPQVPGFISPRQRIRLMPGLRKCPREARMVLRKFIFTDGACGLPLRWRPRNGRLAKICGCLRLGLRQRK